MPKMYSKRGHVTHKPRNKMKTISATQTSNQTYLAFGRKVVVILTAVLTPCSENITSL